MRVTSISCTASAWTAGRLARNARPEAPARNAAGHVARVEARRPVSCLGQLRLGFLDAKWLGRVRLFCETRSFAVLLRLMVSRRIPFKMASLLHFSEFIDHPKSSISRDYLEWAGIQHWRGACNSSDRYPQDPVMVSRSLHSSISLLADPTSSMLFNCATCPTARY